MLLLENERTRRIIGEDQPPGEMWEVERRERGVKMYRENDM